MRRTGTSAGPAIVRVEADDSVDFSSEWSLSGTLIEDAVFFRRLEMRASQPQAALLLEGAPSWQNPVNHLDTDGNQTISPRDVLTVVNVLNVGWSSARDCG